eukprot:Sspe_Gene.41053::Locus_19845_Transcript_1_1_Confidence_1.000_Length_2310::g.41053::m.41053
MTMPAALSLRAAGHGGVGRGEEGMSLLCEHRHPIPQCGHCPRHDLQVGDDVQVADQGTGRVVTWFDGKVARKTADGKVVVQAGVFGECEWDLIRPSGGNLAGTVRGAPHPAPSPAHPNPPLPPAQAPGAPLTTDGGMRDVTIGSVVMVADQEAVAEAFAAHSWTATDHVLAKSRQKAEVVAVDSRDRTLQLAFRGEERDRRQWWPLGAIAQVNIKFDEVEGETSSPPPPTKLASEQLGVREAEVQHSLAVADAAVEIYKMPPDSPSAQMCGHGVVVGDCGRCPRTLREGERV